MSQRMVSRGFRSDFAAVDKVLNVAVVAAYLPQRTGPQQVAALSPAHRQQLRPSTISRTTTVLQITARGPMSAAFSRSPG